MFTLADSLTVYVGFLCRILLYTVFTLPGEVNISLCILCLCLVSGK